MSLHPQSATKHRSRRAALILSYIATFLVLLTAEASSTNRLVHSWVSAEYRPCPGIGLAATFRVHVSGSISDNPDSTTLHGLVVHASSAAFTAGQSQIGATAYLRRAGSTLQEFTLTRPTAASIEPARASNESDRLYLPAGTRLELSEGAELWVRVTASVRTPSGSCPLGTSDQRVPVP